MTKVTDRSNGLWNQLLMTQVTDRSYGLWNQLLMTQVTDRSNGLWNQLLMTQVTNRSKAMAYESSYRWQKWLIEAMDDENCYRWQNRPIEAMADNSKQKAKWWKRTMGDTHNDWLWCTAWLIITDNKINDKNRVMTSQLTDHAISNDKKHLLHVKKKMTLQI